MIGNTNLFSGPYVTDGGTVNFPVTFPFFDTQDIAAYQVTTATGVATQLTLNSDYTLTGGKNVENMPDVGNVTLIAAPAAGFTIVILRGEPLDQLTDLTNQAAYYPDVLEQTLDRLTCQTQMLQEEINRCYKVGPGGAGVTPGTLVGGVVNIQLVREPVIKTMLGDAQANAIFGKFIAHADCYVDEVVIEAYAGAPTGSTLVVSLKVAGSVSGQTYVLPDAADFALTLPATPTTVFVPKGAIVEWFFSQVGSTTPGTNVTVTTQFRMA